MRVIEEKSKISPNSANVLVVSDFGAGAEAHQELSDNKAIPEAMKWAAAHGCPAASTNSKARKVFLDSEYNECKPEDLLNADTAKVAHLGMVINVTSPVMM
jgi:hypothetical protein